MTRRDEPPSSELTPLGVYLARRRFLRSAGVFAASAVGTGGALAWLARHGRLGASGAPAPTPADFDPRALYTASPEERRVWEPVAPETPTPYEKITTYNNFYELGLAKSDPAERAGALRTSPWTVRVDGEVHAPGTLDIDTLRTAFGVEERIYRFRCVETWSMVVPWLGFPVSKLLARVRPTSHARYVSFESIYDPEHLPGQASRVLPWPYTEGLRLDEAMHPLTLLAVGLYGKLLPAQNGAPLRLVVPWKYGFKSGKSIVRIHLSRERPKTTWNEAAADEYGFYANVNPSVAHPRWSQAEERRLGELDKRKTLPFNGYGAEVASLYAGMDLRRDF